MIAKLIGSRGVLIHEVMVPPTPPDELAFRVAYNNSYSGGDLLADAECGKEYGDATYVLEFIKGDIAYYFMLEDKDITTRRQDSPGEEG
jgi:hypothetical protein